MRSVVLVVLLFGCEFSTRTNPDMIDAATIDGVSPEGLPLDGPRGDWWDSRWHVRYLVSIDTSKLAGPVAEFPVLLRLRSAEIDHTQLGAMGASIRIVSTDHVTVFAHELDSLAATPTGTSFVWVKLSLDPLMATQVYLYADNPQASSSSSGAAVFGSFTSVHHLGTNGLVDATGHGHTATSTGQAVPGSTTTNVGTASTFDGGDHLELPNENDFDFTNAMSFSAWARIADFDVEYQTIISKGDTAWRAQRAAGTRAAQFGTNDPGLNLDGARLVDDNTWHHVAITFDGTTKRLFVDGVADGTQSAGTIQTNAFAVRIGMNQEAGMLGRPGGLRYWDGALDEIRIRATNQVAAWFRAEFVTVSDPAFVTIGAGESY